MRRVEITITKRGADGLEDVKETGVFHQWGTTFEEFEHGAVQVSIGIVELHDGTVETAIPSRIKFIPDHVI